MNNPKTLLDLAQRLGQEAAVNGIAPASTAQNLTDEPGRLVAWIIDAEREVYGNTQWRFFWENPTVVVPAATNLLATDIPAQRWIKEQTYYIPTPGAAVKELTYVRWEYFTRAYRQLNGDDQVTAWTIRPDNAFVLNAKVTANLSISVERFKNPVFMSADTDEPPIPEDLRMILVWYALKKYAGYDEAGVQRELAVDEARSLMEALKTRCLIQEMTIDSGSLLDQYCA